jgi:hypothetical protein
MIRGFQNDDILMSSFLISRTQEHLYLLLVNPLESTVRYPKAMTLNSS